MWVCTIIPPLATKYHAPVHLYFFSFITIFELSQNVSKMSHFFKLRNENDNDTRILEKIVEDGEVEGEEEDLVGLLVYKHINQQIKTHVCQ